VESSQQISPLRFAVVEVERGDFTALGVMRDEDDS
jgi:hypothetical protein